MDGIGYVVGEADTVFGLDFDDYRGPDTGDLEGAELGAARAREMETYSR